MSYGLDFEGVRYETDHAGNRLKATIPYTMFSALVEFWIAARRAQTASLEARSKPGQYKGSLPVIPEANTESPSPFPEEACTQTAGTSFTPPRAVHDALYADSQWRALMARMPVESGAPPLVIETPVSPAAVALNASAAESTTKPKKKRHFYREFIASPPAEVATRIECGTYFTRAWREYRGLSLDDTAELYDCGKTTIIWHESGKTVPKPETLKKLADIYDAPLDQFTPKPGTDDSPFVRSADTPRCSKPKSEVATAAPRKSPEPRSPAEMDYPDQVLAHLADGKSPMLAWRLYRRMTLADLADQYGGKAGNIKAMEAQAYLRRSTVDKLAPIFHCKPEQLYRPEGMPSPLGDTPAVLIEPSSMKPRKRTPEPAEVPAMSEAMGRAVTLQETEPRRSRATKNQRLARMQAELSRL
jgi:transcriptional regulator with XRE-family HTH domain